MLLESEERGDVSVVRVKEAKLTYPILSAFFAEVRQLVEAGARRLVLDLSAVGYVDSASIGCLMTSTGCSGQGRVLVLSGLQPRVETMISMTGVHKIIALHATRPRRSRLSDRGGRAAGDA